MLSGTHVVPRQDRVVYGRPAATVIPEEAARLGARRVFLVTGRSVAATRYFAGIKEGLGQRLAGIYDGVTAHSPRQTVLAGSAAARAAGADLLVAIGGGSVLDAAKAMLICLWEDVTTFDQLDAQGGAVRPRARAGSIRLLAVSTTLSGAEYTQIAGITNTENRTKNVFEDPLTMPQIVVLDPAATLETPAWLLHSTGIRAVDHGVEIFCSTGATPYSDALSVKSLELLFAALPRLKEAPDDLDNRLLCQLGVWLSIAPLTAGTPVGASHAIGRVLGGSFGVPHGRTSCAMLPPTLRWNASVNAERQSELNRLIAGQKATLADTIADLVARLGEPGSLHALGLDRAILPDLAAKSMVMLGNASVSGNPRPVHGTGDIMEILELAW